MSDNEKQFIENWQQYHTGMGKWQFIAMNGFIAGAILHILFSLFKFLFYEEVSIESFKNFFFTGTFLVEWLAYTVFIGVFIGFVVWKISDMHYVKLSEND